MFTSFKLSHVQRLFTLLIIVLSLSTLMKIMTLFLDDSDVSYTPSKSFSSQNLYRISALFVKQALTVSTQTKSVDGSNKVASFETLDKWKLQAIYREGNTGGIIVVLVDGETQYLSMGETLKGYKLIKINKQDAVLLRSGKSYSLFIADISGDNLARSSVVQAEVKTINVANLKKGIVDRRDINDFMTDPSKIWSNIKIASYHKGRPDSAFIVRFVKKNSVFDHLGLKLGDIIQKVNGVRMKNFKDAQAIYAGIDSFESLVITVKRKANIKELFYEIQ